MEGRSSNEEYSMGWRVTLAERIILTRYNMVCRVPTRSQEDKEQPPFTWVVNIPRRVACQGADRTIADLPSSHPLNLLMILTGNREKTTLPIQSEKEPEILYR